MRPVEKFGVTRLNLIAVRHEPSWSAPWCTQLLFGDHYQVIAETTDQKFLRIKIYADGVEGWIDSRQHHDISQDYFDYLCRSEFKITTDVTSSILYNKTAIVIVMGSIIPISSAELFRMEEQFAFNGESKSLGQYRDAEYLRTQIQKYVGAPYLPGGKSPFGIDEGGFVQMAYKFCGYMLPRYPAQQLRYGRPVSDLSEACLGDLLFLETSGKNPRPAILIDIAPYQIVHVDEKVRVEELDPDVKIAGIRRILTAV